MLRFDEPIEEVKKWTYAFTQHLLHEQNVTESQL